MPKDRHGNELEFVNSTRIDGIQWAQIATRMERYWWRTDMPDEAYLTTEGPWVIDMEDWPDAAAIKHQLIILGAAKVLIKKVSKVNLRAAVSRARSVHTKARQVEKSDFGSRSWFG